MPAHLDLEGSETAREVWRLVKSDSIGVSFGYRSGDYVFTREDCKPYAPDYVTRAFREAIARTELPRVRLHDLRHGWACLALQAGVNPKIVSERLGHATVAFTLDAYNHVAPGLQEDAAARVAALLRD